MPHNAKCMAFNKASGYLIFIQKSRSSDGRMKNVASMLPYVVHIHGLSVFDSVSIFKSGSILQTSDFSSCSER